MRTYDMLAAISWDPGFRGILVVAVGVIVLMGSVYLLLATNTGARLGFLLALTGLMGWMTIMGLVWSMYGIGRQGRAAAWKVEEVNYSDLTQAKLDLARNLPEPDQLPNPEDLLKANPKLAAQFPPTEGIKRPSLGDLLGVDPGLEDQIRTEGNIPDGWTLLASSNPQTGEAQASASAYAIDERKLFTAQTDFVVLNAFSYGGKEPRPDDECKATSPSTWGGCLSRAAFKLKRLVTWPFGHPTHYAVVQVQRVVPQETQPGQAPPLPKADETQPVTSVIMVRDLGSKRLPSVGVMLFSGIVFAVCCNSLHRRDKLVAEARTAAATA